MLLNLDYSATKFSYTGDKLVNLIVRETSRLIEIYIQIQNCRVMKARSEMNNWKDMTGEEI
jgi:hypothetical protein